MELATRSHRVLPGERVQNKQRLCWIDLVAKFFQFTHQLIVNRDAAGGIDDQPVGICCAGCLYRVLCHLERAVASGILGMNWDVDLLTQLNQLIDRCRALQVTGGQHYVLLQFFADLECQLRRRGGFTGSVESDHHDYRWRAI